MNAETLALAVAYCAMRNAGHNHTADSISQLVARELGYERPITHTPHNTTPLPGIPPRRPEEVAASESKQ